MAAARERAEEVRSDEIGAAGCELGRLLAARMEAHRLAGAAPMTVVRQLQDWIDERAIALVSGKSALPNAAEAIAAGPIAGSWWGAPEGSLIYRLLSELDDVGDTYLDLVLVEGKRTLVSQRLEPAVVALAADPDRRRRVTSQLSEPASRLLQQLASGRIARSDEPDAGGKEYRSARADLERGLLARSTSVHTASGHHVSLLQAYGKASPSTAAEQSDTAGAELAALLRAALDSAVVAERTEVDRWFRFVEPDRRLRSEAMDTLGARRLDTGGRVWMTMQRPEPATRRRDARAARAVSKASCAPDG